MIRCEGICHAVCDFCLYFERKMSDEGYEGEGCCHYWKREMEGSSQCPQYHCFRSLEAPLYSIEYAWQRYVSMKEENEQLR